MTIQKQIHQIPGLILTDYYFDLPLDYAKPQGKKIAVFVREVITPENQHQSDLPCLLFFQGGPGLTAPRPDAKSGWLARALQEYRVFFLDSRGTGLSTPVNFQSLTRQGSPLEQAQYLQFFRADSIVKDAEQIRKILLGDTPWSILGQSFGGFCVASYLSFAPDGLREAIIAGGIPPIGIPIDDIYRASYQRCIKKNQKYYQRYPDDVARVNNIINYLKNNQVKLPSGILLSPENFLQLGLSFGLTLGFEKVHYLVMESFIEGKQGQELNFNFLRNVENALPFDMNPLYALLHEAIYCEGNASNWSASRVLTEFSQFNLERDSCNFFRGEMIYPWLFTQYPTLKPLKQVAEILASEQNWPPLYDLNKLRINKVPTVAAVYGEDLYIDPDFSKNAAEKIHGIKLWQTNDFEHDAIRVEGEQVLNQLLNLLPKK